MENILKEIASVVGVEGCFLSNEDGQVLSSIMPDSYEQSGLAAMGRILTQTISGLSLARRRKVWEIDMIFDRTRLLAKNTGEGCLLIFGTPDMNIHFLNLTADLAVKKIKEVTHDGQALERGSITLGLPEAVRTLIEFINQMLQEGEKQGISPNEVSNILNFRIKKLQNAHPSFKGIAAVDKRLDISGIALQDLDRAQARAGIEFLLHGLYMSMKGIMGEKKAEKAYLSVYDPYFRAHKPAFSSLEFEDGLREIVRSDFPPSHTGVEISLD